jgi:hypothetical protein
LHRYKALDILAAVKPEVRVSEIVRDNQQDVWPLSGIV